jgi:hypothetical protein
MTAVGQSDNLIKMDGAPGWRVRYQRRMEKCMAHRVEESHKPDTAETGAPRLHAPQRPRAVESGTARLQTSVLGRLPPAVESGTARLQNPVFSRPPVGGMRPVTSTRPHAGAGLDTTESGPPRLVLYRR